MPFHGTIILQLRKGENNDVRDLLEHLGFPVNYRFEESEEE